MICGVIGTFGEDDTDNTQEPDVPDRSIVQENTNELDIPQNVIELPIADKKEEPQEPEVAEPVPVPKQEQKPQENSEAKPEPKSVTSPQPKPEPEPTPEPEPDPAPAPKPEQDVITNTNSARKKRRSYWVNGSYLGSSESDKFHDYECRAAKTILAENEVWFASENEAKAAGYSRCGICWK